MMNSDIAKQLTTYIEEAINRHQELFLSVEEQGNYIISELEKPLLYIPFEYIILLFSGALFYKYIRVDRSFSTVIKASLFAAFAALGLLIIQSFGYQELLIQTLVLVLVSTFIALLIGIPIGIIAAKIKLANHIVRPVLDIMQTTPSFVYLIPVVMIFGLGKLSGAMATVIFAMPPAVRLTTLGIQTVPQQTKEAARAFGATHLQMLVDVELPLALKVIYTGINQTIMLALSMVVITSMIGAEGLGGKVYEGTTTLNLELGFKGGFAIIILAILLDRLTSYKPKK